MPHHIAKALIILLLEGYLDKDMPTIHPDLYSILSGNDIDNDYNSKKKQKKEKKIHLYI